jgi:hypothetical protein
VAFVALIFAVGASATRLRHDRRPEIPSAFAQAPTTSASAAASAKGPKTPAALAESAGANAGARGRPPKKPEGETEPAPGLQKVTVGIYVHHITQIDLRANTFLADFYVWLRWKGDLDPTRTFELRNAVEQWQIVKSPVYVDDGGEPAPVTLDDGSKYQVFRVEARMGRPFSVKHYPLDEQDLPIEIEEARSLSHELAYEIDREGSGIDKRIEIPGWSVTTFSAGTDEVPFATNFGDPRARPGERYSRLRSNIHIVRPIGGMLVKTIVPLAIVILITFGVFLVDPHLIDARLGLSVTALVSAIALHFTTATELPEVGYLVLLDKIYILSYLVILFSCAASIFGARLAERERLEKAQRLDRIVGIAVTALFFGGTAFILLFR